jgi:hypothetical protein
MISDAIVEQIKVREEKQSRDEVKSKQRNRIHYLKCLSTQREITYTTGSFLKEKTRRTIPFQQMKRQRMQSH